MLVHRFALELRQVQGDRVGSILGLAKQLMTRKVILRQCDEYWVRRDRFIWEELRMDIVA
jgi:hypothetical protein